MTASDQQIIDFNKSKYHALFHLTHLVIHKCVKVPTIIRLDVEKKLMKYRFLVFLPKMLSKNLQRVGKQCQSLGKVA